ncbi:cystathionine beta-lyase [Collimonas sp.]|jgi:cystathionine beta-lyase|uniref:cystathionine beta-lyase n=1 Tax=Collimonas sp. TaxID=1963772 RepID=UPI002CE2BA6C|nr:cystathionine beta-lyase [Collimonas sp.]HWX03955.1 cystathionine beta-lyase [Collimonas sp.]
MSNHPTSGSPATHVDTQLLHCGREPARFGGMVNTPVFRGSTIIANNLEDWEAARQIDNPMSNYGRFGTPTTRSFEQAIVTLEGGHNCLVFPSGLSACTHSIMAFVKSGDHILVTDSVYGPTRTFADRVLRRMGVEVEFFDPLIGGDIRHLLRPNTSVVFVESPGSWTFEVQDIPAIAEEAHKVGAYVLLDNTWATPLFFKPFEHGVDVSIHAATKYIVGHSDALLGVASANERAWNILKNGAHDFGQTAGPDDIYLALRGMRSMAVRLRQHSESGIQLAEYLQSQPLVERVLHPALPSDPGHKLWQRDFLGASGLFTIALKEVGRPALSKFFDGLQLFGIGLSWGGFESLALPLDKAPTRVASKIVYPNPLVRIHVGLENIDDLIADMGLAFKRMEQAI